MFLKKAKQNVPCPLLDRTGDLEPRKEAVPQEVKLQALEPASSSQLTNAL